MSVIPPVSNTVQKVLRIHAFTTLLRLLCCINLSLAPPHPHNREEATAVVNDDRDEGAAAAGGGGDGGGNRRGAGGALLLPRAKEGNRDLMDT